MPERARRVAALVASLGFVTGLPGAAMAVCTPHAVADRGLPLRLASPAPAAVVTLRVPARRAVCGTLARVPRSGLTVFAIGERVVVRRGARLVAGIAAGRRSVSVALDPVADRVRLRVGGRTVARRVALGVLGPVRTAAGVRASAAPTVTRVAIAGASGAGPFAAGSVFQAPFSGSPAPEAQSGAVVADLADQVRRFGSRVDHAAWSVPVYVVPARQPTVRVRDADDGIMERRAGTWSWGRVPLPPGAWAAPPAQGDRLLVVWQPATDTMWEFGGFRYTARGPVADRGARITDVAHNPGTVETPWGASTTGIPLAAGLVTAADVAAGRIAHAVGVGVPELRAQAFRPPAVRSDGVTWRVTAPEAGMRLRLDPSLDLTTLRLTPFARMVAAAAQVYGLVVRDTSGAVTVRVEDPQPWGRNLLTPALAGGNAAAALAGFPWERLQLVG